MIDPQVAFDKLAQFEISKDIADYFHAEGIKGYLKDPNMCPIATFMERHTGIKTTVLEEETKGSGFEFENTPAMYGFIKHFDNGEYDFLQAGNEKESDLL